MVRELTPKTKNLMKTLSKFYSLYNASFVNFVFFLLFLSCVFFLLLIFLIFFDNLFLQ